ncbi:MAG: hypothetical protein E6H44_13545 [Betaproteobacteria bacterium]|nr:MAG: hypothetical protein E6H44_13545 [Betaproteobacteria bacterium]
MENREKPVDAARVLGQARFFSGLTRTQLDRVAALGRVRAFPQDTRIYVVGDAVDDFYVLADGMVRFTLGLGKRVGGFDAEFSAFLENYPWPGNVRELENMIERAVILAEADLLTGRDLAEVAPALPMVRAAVPLPGGARPLAIEEYIREVIERFQDSHSETELARMLGIGRKALWMRRRQWGLKRTRKDVSR